MLNKSSGRGVAAVYRLPQWEENQMTGIGSVRRMALMAGVILLAVGTTVALTPAYAAGGGGGSGGGGSGGGGSGRGGGGSAGNWSGSGLITCARGQIYSQKKKRCVQMKGEILNDDALTDYAYALAKANRYDEALETLDMVQNPNTPKALNYRGYVTRKLGRTEEGISYYLKSVAMDPHYVQVREYLGEAYVIQGKLGLAKEQLHVIESLCGTVCEEYLDLSEVIKTASN
jgi:tetratricopeptide (TPR) repeat protein